MAFRLTQNDAKELLNEPQEVPNGHQRRSNRPQKAPMMLTKEARLAGTRPQDACHRHLWDLQKPNLALHIAQPNWKVYTQAHAKP